MMGPLIIVFREVLEAGLVVGIVLAATRGLPYRGLWVGLGILAGALGSAIVAMFAGVAAIAGIGLFDVLLAPAASRTPTNQRAKRTSTVTALGSSLSGSRRGVATAFMTPTIAFSFPVWYRRNIPAMPMPAQYNQFT